MFYDYFYYGSNQPMVSRFQWILTLEYNYAEIERVFPIINSIYLTEYCHNRIQKRNLKISAI